MSSNHEIRSGIRARGSLRASSDLLHSLEASLSGGSILSARLWKGRTIEAQVRGEAVPFSRLYASVGVFGAITDFSARGTVTGGITGKYLSKATEFTTAGANVEDPSRDPSLVLFGDRAPDLILIFETALQE